jgi:hypothetical protein
MFAPAERKRSGSLSGRSIRARDQSRSRRKAWCRVARMHDAATKTISGAVLDPE